MPEDLSTKLRTWLDRLGAGDDAALNEMLAHYEARLMVLARRMLRGYQDVRLHEETADVLQNALIRLDRALRDLASKPRAGAKAPGTRDFLGLAAEQIRRELIDLARHYRGAAGRVKGTARGGADPPPEPESPDTWDFDRLAEWTAFHEAAAGLPEKAREVFDLLWYQGLKQPEAAEVLGVDVRTVKNRWLDARLRLAEKLGGLPPGTD